MTTDSADLLPHRTGGAPTLVQVAARAAVSLKTASRAVNGEPYVSDETRTRVLDAARSLGFQLNRTASMLARGIDSNMVGLITGDLANPFYSALAKGIEQELRSHGAQLTVASSDEEPERERELIHELVSWQVRALVLVSTIEDHRAMRAVQARGIPVVFVDRTGIGLEADSVVLDNRGGTQTAVEHLIDAGHTSIGFIGDLSRLQTHRERFHGFVMAMSHAGLDPHRSVRHEAHNVTTARDAAHDLLTQRKPPTALFTSNNRITIGALQAMSDLEVEPALVGFDDFELADVLGITVIAHDPVEMGRTAARLALEATDHRRSQPTSVVIGTRLLTRGSGERRPS
ncbi:MAG: LacI family DNA-binding transcriptional regulator [Propionicimonas sp.]